MWSSIQGNWGKKTSRKINDFFYNLKMEFNIKQELGKLGEFDWIQEFAENEEEAKRLKSKQLVTSSIVL